MAAHTHKKSTHPSAPTCTPGSAPIKADPYNRYCPTRAILDRIGDRWTVLILGALESGPIRYSHILKRVDGISQKMLTQTLHALERDGLIIRVAYAEVPPHVEYSLSELGQSLRKTVKVLEVWSVQYVHEVQQARADYDDRNPPKDA